MPDSAFLYFPADAALPLKPASDSSDAADTSPPSLTGLVLPDFDVTAGAQTLVFTASASDVGSGIAFVQLSYDPATPGVDGPQSTIYFFGSGDSFADGSSSRSVTLADNTPAGTYTITRAFVQDSAGNSVTYTTAELAALGIDTAFTVASNAVPDTSLPVLTGLVLPDVDVTAGATSAIFTASASDSGTGVAYVQIRYSPASPGSGGAQSAIYFMGSIDSFADGSSSRSHDFAADTPAGTYTVTSVFVQDQAGNSRTYSTDALAALGIDTAFTVTSPAPPDTVAPHLTGLVLPDIDVRRGPHSATFTALAGDSGTGVAYIQLAFGPAIPGSGGPISTIYFFDSSDSFDDGRSSRTLDFATDTPAGTYTLTQVFVQDGAGNYTTYSFDQLVALGIDTSFNILSGPPQVREDFDGDGRADLLWRHPGGGFASWLGQADGSFAHSGRAANPVDMSWRIAGTGDVNGDGRDDILWRHDGGAIAQWLGQADASFVNNAAGAAMLDPSWTLAAMGDFDGDRRADAVWLHSSGAFAGWLGQPDGSFVHSGRAANPVDPSWRVVGSGDYDGDGRDDLLWRHDSGVIAQWLGRADGSFFNNGAAAFALDLAWTVIGTGDFDGDGRADILARDSSGRLAQWTARPDGSFALNPAVASGAPPDWRIAAIGDHDGDGRDDLVWRHDGGALAAWTAAPDGSFTYNPAPATTLDPAWQIQSPDVFYY